MSWFIAEVVLQAKLKFSVIEGKTLTGTRERLFFFHSWTLDLSTVTLKPVVVVRELTNI